MSPSMRREWIEMAWVLTPPKSETSPSMRREWIEIFSLRPVVGYLRSPSMRREWIEIVHWVKDNWYNNVSLHAEGVD